MAKDSATARRGAGLRQVLVRSAGEHGMGVHMHTENDMAEWSVGLIGYPAPMAEPAANQAMTAGSLSCSVQAMGWVGTWRMQAAGTEHEWGVAGIGYDVALYNLVRGAVMLMAGTGAP